MSFHGNAEECDEVHDENWPEDGYVEEIEEGAGKRDHRRLSQRVDFEFGGLFGREVGLVYHPFHFIAIFRLSRALLS